MIKSEIGRGLIYAGDTPLASTISIAQTGPLELTVGAGSFTTTGQARIVEAALVPSLDAMIAAGKAEMLPDGVRARVWLQDVAGNPVEPSVVYTLSAPQVVAITPDAALDTQYQLWLGSSNLGEVDVIILSMVLDGLRTWVEEAPAGWSLIHFLTLPFTVPAATATLDGIDIYALEVRPGFPSGTSAVDWKWQSGVGVV